jgi:hypothetical protein
MPDGQLYTVRPHTARLAWGRGLRVGFGLFGVLRVEGFGLLANALWKSGGSKRGI